MSMFLPLSTAGDPPTSLATVACLSYCLMISRALSHDEKYVQVFFRWRKYGANMNVVIFANEIFAQIMLQKLVIIFSILDGTKCGISSNMGGFRRYHHAR